MSLNQAMPAAQGAAVHERAAEPTAPELIQRSGHGPTPTARLVGVAAILACVAVLGMLPTGSTGALIIDPPTRGETGRGLQELRAKLVEVETELRTVRTELVDARQELVAAVEKLRLQGEEIKRIKGQLKQNPSKRPAREDGGIMRG